MVLGVAVAGWLLSGCGAKGLQTEMVQVGTAEIRVEVARTVAERERGLSGRERLAPDSGMLFMFDRKARYVFWMKEMVFPLDFIWLNGNRVLGVTGNVPVLDQNGQVPVISPREVVDKVIEVNAGFVALHRVKVGDLFEVKGQSL